VGERRHGLIARLAEQVVERIDVGDGGGQDHMDTGVGQGFSPANTRSRIIILRPLA
jgi:hypothetical protein